MQQATRRSSDRFGSSHSSSGESDGTPERTLRRRRAIRRRRRIAVFSVLGVLLALLIGTGVYLPAAASAAVPAALPTVTQPVLPAVDPVVSPVWPSFGRGAIGATGFDGVLASSGDQSAFPIASITKVVTAMVVLDAHPLAEGEDGPEIEFTSADVEILDEVLAQDGSWQAVEPGVVMSQREVMETMLIPSANNYAESLAVWAYGSVDAYLAAARAWLDGHGLTDTTVVDTNGLNAGDTSTPANLVALGQLALAQPAIAAIVVKQSAEEPYVGEIDNTNGLLGTSGIDGIKTGTTDEAGACLLFSTDVVVGAQSITVVGVILGAEDHDVLDAAVLDLLASVTPGFQELPLVTEGEAFASYETVWGETATAVSSETKSVLVWSGSDTTSTAAVTAEPLDEGTAGESVGQVDFTVGSQTVSVPLVLDAAIEEPDFEWRVMHPPWTRDDLAPAA
ncbi:D-alanyl-D-alanine carboxypeptidase family protein [Naasia lichenicola]|uniref:D-alanyl-D-alanine carboxypeptidase n=1 Tax=Naasia lichenicola TaxID=2565933 RepID=A0A4S4FR98_9MICO|nr:D-alanyl-D-alanine carboxypeptidase [Naasia lichenicola]THG33139.1 D-alanyl-D-alanine carboxypeptidase [Naasia lichenicola]